MKKILWLIAYVFIYKGLIGQQRYAYLPEGTTIFQTSGQKVLFGFKKGFSHNILLKNKLGLVLADTSQFPEVENKKWNVFNLKSTLATDSVNNFLVQLRNDTSVLYANRFLVYKDGTLEGLTDQLVVRLKTSTGQGVKVPPKSKQ